MSEAQGTVVVTGATGFIGRALCTRLQQMDFAVRAAARSEKPGPWSEFVRIDLPGVIPDKLFGGVRLVFHLAGRAHAVAESRSDEALYREINTRGAEETAKRAKKAGVRRFVFMSTVKALGEPGSDLVREDQPSTATDPYGASKREAEQAVMAIASPDFEVVILRPALVYGPGAKGNLESLLQLLRRGRMPPLPRVNNRRSMVGINDLIEATVTAGRHPRTAGQTYTITDGEVYSTTQIIEILAAASGITRPAAVVLPISALRLGARVGDAAHRVTGRRFLLDSQMVDRLFSNAEYESVRLARDTGFRPRQSLSDLAPSMVQRAS